jgi:hypothetical protein
MIAQFAVRLICGMSVTWLLMPRGQVTAGFFRIQTLVTLGLAVLTAVTLGRNSTVTENVAWLSYRASLALAVFIAVLSYVASVLWMLGRRRPGGVALYGIAAGAVILLPGMTSARDGGPAAFVALSELSAAWLMGGAVTAMLLGHWHLTATSMSLAPLTRLNQLVGAAALARGFLAAAGLLTLPEHRFTHLDQICYFLRWTSGCVGPIVMVLLVGRILRFRNTQSATGVLFAAVILIFIGETTAALLARDVGWPL